MKDVENAGDAKMTAEMTKAPKQDPVRIDVKVLDTLFVRPNGAEQQPVRRREQARDELPDENQCEHGEDKEVGAPDHCGQRAEVSGHKGQEEAVRAACDVARVEYKK